MASKLLLSIISVCFFIRNAFSQNIRGADPPACLTDCDGGGCDYNDCNSNAVACGGGGCTFTNCRNPSCPGGGCEFYSCTNPRCRGGGCSFIGCQGGDTPGGLEVVSEEEEEAKGGWDGKIHKSWSAMSSSEREEMLSVTTPAPRPESPELDTKRYDNVDSGSIDGWEVPLPPKAKEFKREKIDEVTTGNGGVLDSAWTVGGRVKGREYAEKDRHKVDLDEWANEVSKMAMDKVAIARAEAENVREIEGKGRSEAVKQMESERQIRRNKQHEAERAADLAIQWQKYAEEVAELNEMQMGELTGENERLQKELDELKGRVPEFGLIEAAKDIDADRGESQSLDHLYTHRENNNLSNHSNASNRTTMKIVAATVAVSVLLTLYILFFTPYVTSYPPLLPTDFSPTPNLPRLRQAFLFASHTFFSIFSMLTATTATVAPPFATVVTCESLYSPGTVFHGITKLAYLVCCSYAFLTTELRVVWYFRLFQLVIVVAVTDWEIHERGGCSDQNGHGIIPSFVSTTCPYYVKGLSYAVCCWIEKKVAGGGSKGFSEVYGEGDGDVESKEEDKNERMQDETTDSAVIRRR